MRYISRHLQRECGIRISQSSVCSWMKHLRYSRKKAFRTVHVNHNAEELCKFASNYQHVREFSDIVCVDETCFYVGDHRRYGYSARGTRLHVKASRTLRRSKFTLIMAIGKSGVLHHQILEGNCNKQVFLDFLQELPVPPGTTLLMDNVAFHHSKSTRDLMASKDWKPMYIPPYSPKLNAIENVFSWITYRSRGPGENRDACRLVMSQVIQSFRTKDFSKLYARVDKFVQEIADTSGDSFCGHDL